MLSLSPESSEAQQGQKAEAEAGGEVETSGFMDKDHEDGLVQASVTQTKG